jgi:transposase InsO family protein
MVPAIYPSNSTSICAWLGSGILPPLPSIPRPTAKIERYHHTLKGEINQIPYDMPSELKEAIRAFIEYYNYRRFHEGLGNVTPYDVYTGRHLEIIQKRKEVKSRTLLERRDYNGTARNKGHGL